MGGWRLGWGFWGWRRREGVCGVREGLGGVGGNRGGGRWEEGGGEVGREGGKVVGGVLVAGVVEGSSVCLCM